MEGVQHRLDCPVLRNEPLPEKAFTSRRFTIHRMNKGPNPNRFYVVCNYCGRAALTDRPPTEEGMASER